MKLFHREFGKGKPIVLLHGLFGMSDNWVLIAKKISEQGYRVVIPDMRNHGQSFHSSKFDYPSMVSDVRNLFDDLCISKAVVCGHSMGGKVAMNFALDFPDKTEKLIVADMGVKEYKVHSSEILDALLAIDFAKISSRQDVEDEISTVIADKSVVQLLMKNLSREANTFEWKINAASIKENLKNIFIEVPCVKTFEKPTLFIRGELSNYLKDSDFDGIKKIFPAALFITVPKGTHWLHADNPEFFLKSVLDFCNN